MKLDLASLIAEANALAAFQAILAGCEDDSMRKRLVIAVHEAGGLTRLQAHLLITAHQLEAA